MNYVAGYKWKRVEIEANDLYAAMQKAEGLLKPKKGDRGLMWILPVQQRVETSGAVALVIDPGLMN